MRFVSVNAGPQGVTLSRKLLVIVASTRPGRIGLAFGAWMAEYARANSGYDVELVDLAEVNLPFFDEPEHPRFGRYQHEHTKAWSRMIGGADAFVFVMPEYNYGFNAVIKNALDYLSAEWRGKPVGFLSYGGVAGGTRAVQLLKPVMTILGMVTPAAAIIVPFAPRYIGEDGEVALPDQIAGPGKVMLGELERLGSVLHP